MTDEPNTDSLEEPIDNVALSEDDTSEDFVYFDPDEDQDTEELEATEETEDEADETEADDEAEGQEAEDQADDDAPIEDLVAKLKAETPRLAEYLDEIEKGNLRQADYTRKAQELSNERTALEENAQRMERVTANFVEYLSSLVPDAPDPSLALSDPNAYTAQKAQHEASMAQVQKLIEMGEQPKEITGEMTEASRQKQLQEANSKLIEIFPEAAGGEGRKAFFNGVQDVANDLGFTNEELSSITDHRIFALAHWAKKGMAAEQAKTKAKAKVAKAPPATPRKPGQGVKKASGNREAMRRLRADDSIENAIAALQE